MKNKITYQPLKLKIDLDINEKLYLKAKASNLNETTILNILEVNRRDLNLIRRSIEKKFKSKNWLFILSTVLKHNIIPKSYFVNKNIISSSLFFSKILFDTLKDNEPYDKVKLNIYDYFENISSQTQRSLNGSFLNITSTEINYLNNYLKTSLQNEKTILPSNDINTKFKKDRRIESSILKNLKVNNIFNAYLKLFTANSLETEKKNEFIEKYSDLVSKELVLMKDELNTTYSDKELKLYLLEKLNSVFLIVFESVLLV